MPALVRRSPRRRQPSSPLRTARLLADLTLSELAERSGLSRTSIHLIERDKQQPTLETAQRLAHALEMSVDSLFPVREDR